MPQHVAPTQNPYGLERIIDDRQSRERALEEDLSCLTHDRVGLEGNQLTGHDLLCTPLQAVGYRLKR